jgi:hypothetical protein
MAVVLSNNTFSSSIVEINDTMDSNKTVQNQVLCMLEKLHEYDATDRIVALTARVCESDTAVAALDAK